MKPRAAWTECWDGFPEGWDGQCGGWDIETSHPFRVSALLGPDGEPLRVPLPRNKIGFDLSVKGNRNG
jgi:hypothetical protein